LEEIERAAKIFGSLVKEKIPKIISHHDADGITSASIMIKSLYRIGCNFELRIVKQLTEDEIEKIKIHDENFLVLLDLGSGQLNFIRDFFEKTQVFVLDHHEPMRIEHPNLFHLNPLLFGESSSASVVTYIFAKFLSQKNVDTIDLAIVGALGDEQDERWVLKGLSRNILREAVDVGKVTVMKGIRLYGRNTRPIHKSLEFSFDPFIPGISGSESNAIQFLSELGIKARDEEGWRKLSDLTVEEQKKLASAIIMERLKWKEEDASDIFGEIYTLIGRTEELQDAREFATILNACGRMGLYGDAFRICFNESFSSERSWEILEAYRKKIGEAVRMIKEGEVKTGGRNVTFIFGEKKIPDTMIGTITSIVVNSNIVPKDKPVLGMAEFDGKIKISLRIPSGLGINARDVLVEAVKLLGKGEAGGHAKAAGALIDKSMESDFVNIIEEIMGEKIGKS